MAAKKAKAGNTSYLNFCELYDYSGEVFYETPDFPPVPTSDADAFVQVDARYLGRLDLVAYDYYRDTDLWWVIALANGLDRVLVDMRIGQTIRVPSESVARTFVQRKSK